VLGLASAADRALVVTTPEPPAMADAYAVIKALAARGAAPPLAIVNRVRDAAEGRDVERRLLDTARRHLATVPGTLGFVPEDPAVRRAVLDQTPFVLTEPGSPAARAVRALALRLSADPGPDRNRDRLPDPRARRDAVHTTLTPLAEHALRQAA
jgi:flagellar biosynthesis protein FlhG